MTQLYANPDKLVDLANALRDYPYASISRAQLALQSAQLDGRAFGVIGSAIMNGSYEDARQSFITATGDAADAMNSGALGLAHVANLYAQAEGANATIALKDAGSPAPLGLSSGNDTFSSIAGGFGGFAGIVLLMGINGAVYGATAACAAVAPAAFVAEVLWALTKPDDTEINNALAAWQSAASDAHGSHGAWSSTLSARLSDAWPSGDGARPNFDAWATKFDTNMSALEAALTNAPTVFQEALSDVHSINDFMLYTVLGILASLIALTALDVFFGAGEAAKTILGIGLNIVVGSAVTSVTTILTRMAFSLGSMAADVVKFDKVTNDTQATFQDLPKITDWSDATPPPGASPTFAGLGSGGGTPPSGSGGGDFEPPR